MGPRSRDLLARVSPDDFSNAGHPFGTAREIEIGMGLARAHRVTYVGELGWELYVSSDQAAHVFETLVEAGEELGLTALRPARDGQLPHREGLPPLRPRHHRRGSCARGGARLRGEDRQGRFHRPRRGAAQARGRARPAAGAVPPERPRAAALPRRADPARRPHRRHSPRATTATRSARPSASATCPARARPRRPCSPPPTRSTLPAAASPPTPPSHPFTTRRASALASSEGQIGAAPSAFLLRPGNLEKQCLGCGGGDAPRRRGRTRPRPLKDSRAHLRAQLAAKGRRSLTRD